jgi:hypothetical protein
MVADDPTLQDTRDAGWYPDPVLPDEPALQRWWDGRTWGERRHWDGTAWQPDPATTTMPDTPATKPWTRRPWVWVVAGVIVLAIAGCGIVAAGVFLLSSNSADPDVDHTRALSTGESSSIAAQLVPVDGYLYQDVSEAEIDNTLSGIREQERANGAAAGSVVAAVSLHAVKADDPRENTALGSVGAEVGFLQLTEFAEAPPAGFLDEAGPPGALRIDRFRVGDVDVDVYQDDSAPQSRFAYVWQRHGVWAYFDGATRDETERWVRAHLAEPVRVGDENDRLAAAADAVPGYLFANSDLGASTESLVTQPIGDVPSSFHLIADGDGMIGKLLLVDPGRSMTADELAAAEAESLGAGRAPLSPVDTTVHNGVEVAHFRSSEIDLYAWVRGDIGGVFVTTQHPDAAVPFIDAYLAANN